jgi:hypothetical protein
MFVSLTASAPCGIRQAIHDEDADRRGRSANDRILPFYQEHQVPLLRALTDRGTDYCGKLEQHDYQLYLALNDTITRARRQNHRKRMGSVNASTRQSSMSFTRSRSARRSTQRTPCDVRRRQTNLSREVDRNLIWQTITREPGKCQIRSGPVHLRSAIVQGGASKPFKLTTMESLPLQRVLSGPYARPAKAHQFGQQPSRLHLSTEPRSASPSPDRSSWSRRTAPRALASSDP